MYTNCQLTCFVFSKNLAMIQNVNIKVNYSVYYQEITWINGRDRFIRNGHNKWNYTVVDKPKWILKLHNNVPSKCWLVVFNVPSTTMSLRDPFTVPCEAQFLYHPHRESNPGSLHSSPLHNRCATPAPLCPKELSCEINLTEWLNTII